VSSGISFCLPKEAEADDGRHETSRQLCLGLASTWGCSSAPLVQAWVGEASRGTSGSCCGDGGAWPATERLGDGASFTKGWWLSFMLVVSIYRGRL
jgi:hypothetical protein